MATGDIHGLIELAREELRHPSRLLGMGAFWTWLQIVFSSPHLSPALNLPIGLPSQHLVWTASLLVTVLVFLLVLVGVLNSFVRRAHAVVLSSLLMAAGSLMLAVSSSPDSGIVFAIFGVIGIGTGSALAFLCWGLHLASLAPRRVLFDMSLYALLTALIFGFFVLLPPMAARLSAVLIPLVEGALLHIANRGVARDSAPINAAHDNPPKRQERQLVGLAVLVGLVYGVMRGTTLSFGTSTVEMATAATVVGVGVAGVLLLVTAVFYRRESELYLVCEVSFPLLAAGFLILPQHVGDGLPLSTAVFAVGHTYFYFLLWVFCVDCSRFSGRNSLRVFAAGLAAFLGSSLVGSLASDIFSLMGFDGSGFIGILSLIVVYLFVLVFALLFSRMRTERSRDLQAIGERRRGDFERCTRFIAEESGLTAREAEVFLLLAQGEDRAAIGERLAISNDTVKTHLRRIYSKLGIHSKQEAQSLVERKIDQESRGM